MTALSRGFAVCAIPVVLGAMVPLSFGCSNSSRVGQADAGVDVKQADAGVDVKQADAGVDVNCDPDGQPVLLYPADGGLVANFAVSDSTVVIATTDAVVTVPIAGGAVVPIAQEISPHGVAVLAGVAYFEGLEIVPSGDPMVPAESIPTLYDVPIAGGNVLTIPAFGSSVPLGADDSSLYLGVGSTRIQRWNPMSQLSVNLDIDPTILVDDVAIAGNYVYLAAQDISQSGFLNGFIGRFDRAGGALDHIVTGIGHPFHVAADDDGLYWAEDPAGLVGYPSGRLARSSLNGGMAETVVGQEPISLAVMSGKIIFSIGTEIDMVSTSGGEVRPVVPGLINAGMIMAQNGRVVWVDPVNLGFRSTNSPTVMSACVGP